MLQEPYIFVSKEVSIAELNETDKTLQFVDRLFTPDFDTIPALPNLRSSCIPREWFTENEGASE